MGSDDEGFRDTDLHLAVRLADLEATEEALKSGCQPDDIGLLEWSALHEAAYNGDLDIIKLLLEFGADPNKADNLKCNTALHYTCLEKHADCLEFLLSEGGDPELRNKDGKSSIQLAKDDQCRKVFLEHGFDIKETPIKSILKTAPKIKSPSVKTTTLPKPEIPKHQQRSSTRHMRTIDAHSPASSDSGVHSPSDRLFSTLKDVWDDRDLLAPASPASPARSHSSSYGSVRSLASSSCSGADDCAGQFVMSFQYNSKTKQFKIRLWEVMINSLMSTSKLDKDTSLQLYFKSTIVPDNGYQPNSALRRKSEAFRLRPGENNEPFGEKQIPANFVWKSREAILEFKNSITLEYKEATKEIVSKSSLDISICVKRKKSFITNRSKHQLQDPVLASVHLSMREAVRSLMKNKYPATRHDVPGITRQSYSLESVVTSDMSSKSDLEISSSPEHVPLYSLVRVEDSRATNRCVSDGDIRERHRNKLTGSTDKGFANVHSDVWIDDSETESNSLDSVTSHSSPVNHHVKIRLPLHQKFTETSFQLGIPENAEKLKSDGVEGKVPRGRPVGHKTRNKIRSRGLISSTTAVTAMDEEERSVGSPSEELEPHGSPYISNLADRHLSLSTGSLVQVDESPSPSRFRKQNRFTQSSNVKRTTPNQHKERKESRAFAVQIEPNNRTTFVAMEKFVSFEKFDQTSKSRGGRIHNRNSRDYGSRPNVLRKLVFDETDLTQCSADNPGFIND